MVALSFPTPDAEAAHIVATAQALRGVAFSEDGNARGLSWSDMAILLRSVRANADPILAALQAARIPFVVTGMTDLFGTGEAEVARHNPGWVRTDMGGPKAPLLPQESVTARRRPSIRSAMMEETATKHAPWYLIPANNKPYGRIVAFRVLADRLGKDVALDPRPIDPELLKEAKRALSLSASDIERASHPAKRTVKLKRDGPGS